MALGDDLLAPITSSHDPCTFGAFIEGSEFRAQLETAVDRIREQRAAAGRNTSHGYTNAWLLQMLRKNGIDEYSRDQIQRHVNQSCACYRRLALASNGSQ